MHIRCATLADMVPISLCTDMAFASFAQPSDTSYVKQAAALQAQILDNCFRVMCIGSRIVGYISFSPAADQLFVDTLAVMPAYHGRGIGTRLLAFADSEALRLGLSGVNLFTKAAMTGNLAFYERRGYREMGRCDDDGYCRVFYCKDVVALRQAS